jgi:hypothetical protein
MDNVQRNKIQKCNVHLLEQGCEINKRDKIKIHSLIHNQLSAAIFNDTVSYAWFASSLMKEKVYL